jgi:hypothetical protein
MNLNYLGDALDHWKGSLFKYLQREGVLCHFAVDPMASDQAQWVETDFAIYRHLLWVNENQLIRHQSTLADRQRYFLEIRHTGDLFLDPDTGISTGWVKKKIENKYIKPQEAASLLHTQDDRLLVVYQHVRATRVSVRVDQCLAAIARETNGFWCSYESGTVAMLFLSRRTDRTSDAQKALQRLLGRHTNRRVRLGEIR